MGRKKGKQKGYFSSKSKLAANLYEFHQHVHEAHQEFIRRPSSSINTSRGGAYAHGLSSNGISKISSKSNIPNGSSPSPTLLTNNNEQRRPLSLTMLRGILRERVFEDRERAANFRRQMMTASITDTNASRAKQDHQQISDSNQTKKKGWILVYNHREAMAGIDQRIDNICDTLLEEVAPKQQKNIPSLQKLCIQMLAVYLQQYIDACGEDYILERLRFLPSCAISALSVSCHEITDEMVYVLGKQTHVKELALCASPSTKYDEIITDDDNHNNNIGHPDRRSGTLFTDNGLLSLCSTHGQIMRSEKDNKCEFYPLDCWEEEEEYHGYDGMIQLIKKETNSLRRLELRNFQTRSASNFIAFLKCHPHITHLSLSHSFNAITGPEILLPNLDDNQDTDCQEKTILNVLVHLQVLDLSGCTWVHDDLLQSFFQRIRHYNLNMTLELIVVDRSYLTRCCNILSEMADSKPILCSEIP